MASQRVLVLGSEENCVPNLPPLLSEVIEDGFDFLAVPLVHPRQRRDAQGTSQHREGAFTRSDLLLPSSSWTRSVVGKLSEWLWPGIESVGRDGEFSESRRSSEDALKQELAWASHLSLPAVLFPQLPPGGVNTCRLINQCVQQRPYYQVWITVPLVEWTASPALLANTGAEAGTGAEASEGESPWTRWNRLRVSCEHSQALFVALELGVDLPESDAEIARWEAEPVKVLLLPVACFLTNKMGFPVLSKRHQAVVHRFAKFNVQILVTGRPRHPQGRKVYQQYLRHAWQTLGTMAEDEAMEAPYLDYLQAPLQPLMDNLESQTYETFEKDPVKYEQYRKAVVLALRDFVKRKSTETERAAAGMRTAAAADAPPPPPPPPPPLPSNEDAAENSAAAGSRAAVAAPQQEIEAVLMVVGAGRGPLVRASLMAGAQVAAEVAASPEKLALTLRVFAVEKNPNAVVTLRALVAREKWTNVTVVSEDMRRWKPSHPDDKADIMVSELLGSFGDNELSPECLDGAQSFLRPGGVSIPVSYTSWLAPLAGAKLWNEARHSKSLETTLKAMETAYVVKVHNALPLTAPQPCFTFEHPNPHVETNSVDNSRYRTFTFKLDKAATIHGLVGYFESRLYGDVWISILPGSPHFSDGMFSWFPLYFPLREPLHAARNEPIAVAMWRLASSNKAWYEWQVDTNHGGSPVHNPNGRSYFIGL